MANLGVYIPDPLIKEFNELRESIPHSEQPKLSAMMQKEIRVWIKRQQAKIAKAEEESAK